VPESRELCGLFLQKKAFREGRLNDRIDQLEK
jgi:hypothetical protein